MLIKSKIGSAFVPTPGGPATSWVDLEFDDQSDLFPCNPLNTVASNCNYLVGGGTWTGDLNSSFNPTFKGGNPKGTWRLLIQDFDAASRISAELEVKTGRRFAKE